MAADSNGWLADASKISGRPNCKVAVNRRPSKRTSASLRRRSFSIVTRLGIWYIIIAGLLWCPSTITSITEDSPWVCSPYIGIRSYITPHLRPYYDAYAASSVERARPYAEDFYQRVYAPSINFTKETYETYGAPRVNEAAEYAQKQWVRTLKPQIQAAQAEGRKWYDSTLAPQVSKFSAVSLPYFEAGRERVLVVYNTQLLPAFTASRPYADQIYALGHKVAIENGLPYIQSGWTYSTIFVKGILWPQVRILYGENVEPQLLRIGERLGRYRDGNRLKAMVEDMDSSSHSSSISSSLSSVSSSITSAYTANPSESAPLAESSAPNASSSLTPEQEAKQTREKIETDLKNWQDKFAKAAGKGAQDLEKRVKEITERQIQTQVANVGESLVVVLGQTSKSELANLKKSIQTIVKSLPYGRSETDIERAEKELSKETRNSGLAVKSKAQALRSWKQSMQRETQTLVNAASKSTLEVIDNIRDLGLQEIGMRWAWMEGISYNDWENYHLLKKTFDEWRQEVEAVALNHAGLQSVADVGNEVESRGMFIAEETAKELGRLKDVGKWKIRAADASDDFSTKHIPAAAVAASQKLVDEVSSANEKIPDKSQGSVGSALSDASETAAEVVSSASLVIVGRRTTSGVVEQLSSKISEAVLGAPQPKAESVISVAKKRSAHVASAAREAVVGTPAPAYQTIVSKASDAVYGSSMPLTEKGLSSASSAGTEASSIASVASKKVFAGAMAQKVGNQQQPILDDFITDDDEGTYSEALQSIVNKAGDKHSDVAKAVSEAILKPTSNQGSVERAASVAEDQYSSAIAAASRVLYGTQKGTMESVTSIASERYSEAVAAASSIIYGPRNTVAPAANQRASSLYSEATRQAQLQYSKAGDIASQQISGSPKPVHEKIQSSIEQAYSQSLTAASQQLQDVLRSASTAVYGKPLSPHQSVLSVANEHYSIAIAAASSQYESVRDAIGSTLKSGYEIRLAEAAQRYSHLTKAANLELASATAAISTPTYALKKSVLNSISSIASSRLADSLSIASARYSSLKTAVGANPTPAHQQYLLEGQRRYYEAIGLAHERYTDFLFAASSAVYGTPTPTYKSLYSVASESLYGKASSAYESLLNVAQSRYSDVASQVSLNLRQALGSASSGKGMASKSGMLESASSQYSSAMSAASASLSSASAAAGVAIHGTPTPTSQCILNAAQSQYSELISQAAIHLQKALSSASSATVKASKTDILDSASSRYSSALSAASASLSSASAAASFGIYDTPTPTYQSFLNAAQSQYSDLISQASLNLQKAVGSADSVTAKASKSGILASASSRYSSLLSIASASLSSASASANAGTYGAPIGKVESVSSVLAEQAKSISSKASTAIIGTETPWTESVASQASQNWEALVSKASNQVYGAPTPFSESVYSQAGEYAAPATGAAVAQYEAVQALFSELVKGKEPDFTESVISRLSSIYHTGYHASIAFSASSYASEAYASASSVVSSVFTPSANIEAIIAAANDQVNAVVEAASVQYYDTNKGTYEKATSAAADSYSSISSAAKEKIYGTPEPDYLASVGKSFDDVASSAQEAISVAIYGTPTPTAITVSITSVVSAAYASASSVIGDKIAAANSIDVVTKAKISEALYSPEKGAVESASSILAAVVESAKARLAQIPDGANEAFDAAKSGVEKIASSVSSVAVAATEEVKSKDEL